MEYLVASPTHPAGSAAYYQQHLLIDRQEVHLILLLNRHDALCTWFVLVDVFGPNSTATMRQLHSMLKEELSQSRHGQSFMLERVLELLYAESIRICTELQRDNAPSWLTAINDKRVGPAVSYIHAHLAESMTVEKLAAQVSLSSSRFAACFRQLVGVSPKTYIASQRQALAARRLLESSRSIQEIAHECGYRSMPSFTKSFVKQFCSTPSKWRSERKVRPYVRGSDQG